MKSTNMMLDQKIILIVRIFYKNVLLIQINIKPYVKKHT